VIKNFMNRLEEPSRSKDGLSRLHRCLRNELDATVYYYPQSHYAQMQLCQKQPPTPLRSDLLEGAYSADQEVRE